MRGPQNSDIDNILAGLKSKNVNIRDEKEDSMISASLSDLTSGRCQKSQKESKNLIKVLLH